jgi:glycosyltransferase involved in cell wall biosynthesis
LPKTKFHTSWTNLRKGKVSHCFLSAEQIVHPCRVVFLIENASFPSDRRVRQEAAALRSIGYEINVVCPKSNEDRATFEVVDGVRVYRYWQPWEGDGPVGHTVEYVWAMMCCLGFILWIWARHGFDVLHAANPPDLFVVIAMPFRLFGKKFVYDQHDLCPELFDTRVGNGHLMRRGLLFFERRSYRSANFVIVPNQSFYDIAIKRSSIRPEKICIVRNGPDLSYFYPGACRPELKKRAAYLALYIGGMAEQDGVNRLVAAACHIVHVRGRKDLLFVLLGDGPKYQEIKRMARSLGVEEHFVFRGWVNDAEILDYLSTADVCLVPDPPSPINQLSTFMKIMEYMSCGKVSISFNLLESRRTAGPAAIYVERDDPALFGDAILEILDDPKKREELGQAALERVRTSLHWGLSRQVLVKAYQQMNGVDALPLADHHAGISTTGS